MNHQGHERKLNQVLIKVLRDHDSSPYVECDTDTPARLIKSGYDLRIFGDGVAMLIETKVNNRPLTDFQKLTKKLVDSNPNVFYVVLRYYVEKVGERKKVTKIGYEYLRYGQKIKYTHQAAFNTTSEIDLFENTVDRLLNFTP